MNLRIKMYQFCVIIFVSLVAFGVQVACAEGIHTGKATTTIDGKEYSYDYRVFSQKRRIEFQAPPVEPDFTTPMHALTTMFSYMKNGMAPEWRKMWTEGKGSRYKATDERFQEGWKVWLSKPHYLLYELSYKGHVIYVTEREEEGERSRAKFFFKKVKDKHMLSQALFNDEFGSILDDHNFDPATGQRFVEPHALYSFEDMQTFFEIVDSATVQLMHADHSINNAKGINVKQGKGVKGNSLVLDGKGYVVFPPSVPLSLYGNKFTISLWMKAERIPRGNDNRVSDNEFASVVLSRGGPASTGFISLEIREKVKNANETTFFVQVGTGPQSLQVKTSIEMEKWTKIEVVYDSVSVDLKVNEKTVAQAKAPGGYGPKVYSQFDRFLLGRYAEKPFFPFVGSVDELAISNEIVK